ncbi:MAG TPA: glutamine--tRNA ligase/YqeY domain fusion protein [Saprospiraceae bacterium]|nr:glutamine--tRNA ligase/YqeY domain fusion protein [Saprospiraceae bacterium]MCB9328628.1 glutamine--tRNA ligase/YqeY domain fusion protein [Lewinellaceae bacterium]HRX29239.1 glutamine--tRNA ligase/YqeY domain fusion protein [Saprospiraceae bacterium]
MSEKKESLNFIEQIIEEDIASGKHGGRVHTRFPPEPNGYLHIGHAKAICINFELAAKYGGKTNLRFDDTNPITEDTEYVEAIKKDIQWLGFQWEGEALFASDYFDQMYHFAIDLIKKGLAYVDDSTPEMIAEMKGTPTVQGKNSPFRDRTIEENLTLFEGMKNGEFPDGSRVLRAKVDMTSPNMLMRDPVMYRIKHAHHHRTGNQWVIYPMYDFAHGQSDSIEHITHSLCSLEFRHHRPLYDWFIQQLEIFPSRQIEFARMNVAYMITSKRRLLKLVQENYVTGWDDPRMPTISGMRRRGYPAEALRVFCDKVGVAKRDNLIEVELLESCVRDVLNRDSERAMVVLNPVKLVITNYPDGKCEKLSVEINPEKPELGHREVDFSREIFIEREDFMEDAPRKFFRLSPGRDVRLKHAYIIHCNSLEKDEEGNVTEIHCSYYPDSRSGNDTSGVKPKGTLHWVNAGSAKKCIVRNYDRLFTIPEPTVDDGQDFLKFYNEESLVVNDKALIEPYLLRQDVGKSFQFLRQGYYCVDADSNDETMIFNLSVSLKEGWKPGY